MPTTPDDRVTILIDGRDFRHWNSVRVHLQVDSFATVEFDAPFDPIRAELRDTFRPFSFKPLEVLIGDERVVYGVLAGVHPRRSATSATVDLSGYALPGRMATSACPESILPLEYRNLGLRQIANALAEPYGILPIFKADAGSKFAKAKAEVDQRPYQFLVELARQRGLIITSDADGNLVFQQSTPAGSPVARMVDGQPPVNEASAGLDPDAYYSHITAFTKHKRGRRGARHTVRNPFLTDVLRPMSFTLDDTDPADAPAAAQAKLGRMFANAATYTVDLATWRDPHGRLWSPNTTATLLAPYQMVYQETELLVRVASFFSDKQSRKASLQLVLPGAFTGEAPEVLPWDG